MPELFPQDVWEDAGQVVKDTQGASTLLPPRKPMPEILPTCPTDSVFPGLRIGSSVQASPKIVEDPDLEVHEIIGTVVRLEPEKPTQSKMPRHVVFHEKPAPQPRLLDSLFWGQSKAYSLKWILGASFGITTLVIAALSIQPFVNRANATKPDLKRALVLAPDENATGESSKLYDDLVARSDEAARIFKDFTTVSTRMKVLPMVRDRDAVEPLILSSHRPVLISKSWAPEKTSRWEVHETQSLPFAILHGTLPDYSEFDAYFVLEDQKLLIDWKATTHFGTATFDELNGGQGDPAEIRGVISPAKYFSPVFPEAEFQNFMLSAPNSEKAIWCYTRRDQPVSDTLTRLCLGGDIQKPSSETHKVTVRLEQGPDEALPNQWIIAELLNDEWISP